MIDLIFGGSVLIVGVEEQPEGWLKVYVGARWKNIYCVVTDPEDQRRVQAAWGSGQHVTMPKPEPHQLYTDADPYVPVDGGNGDDTE